MADRNKRNGKSIAVRDNKKNLKIAVISVLSVFLAAILVVVGIIVINKIKTNAEEKKQLEIDGKVIGVATDGTDSYEVAYDEFRFVTLTYKENIAKTYGEDINAWDDSEFAEAHRDELESAVKSNLTANCATLAMCKTFQVDPYADDVDDAVDEQIEEIIDSDFDGKKKDYKAWLEENNLTDRFMRYSCRMQFLESRLYYAMVDGGIYIDYNESNRTDFINFVLTTDTYRRTLSILIENQADAKLIYMDLQSKTGDDRVSTFKNYVGSALNKDYGNDTTGHGYYFTKGEMSTEYEDTAFALKNIYDVGMSEKTANGYYIIIRMPMEEAYVTSKWEDLLDGYQAAIYNQVEKGYKDSLTFEFNDEGKQYDLTKLK